MTQTIGKTKAKETARGIRVWIEGTKVFNAGFAPGDAFGVAYDFESREVSILKGGDRKVSGSYRGDKPRPIIDLVSQSNARIFEPGQPLLVVYEQDLITIRGANG